MTGAELRSALAAHLAANYTEVPDISTWSDAKVATAAALEGLTRANLADRRAAVAAFAETVTR